MTVIQARYLTKVFMIPRKDPGLRGAVKALFAAKSEEKRAVDGVSFQIDEGEVVGYIGVNGAGKSTTIKMLTGILVPTSGSAIVLGRDPHRQRVANAREIGVVFGQRTQLWWDLAFIESLNLVAGIYQVPEARYKGLLALNIYPGAIRVLLTWPIPYGFVSFYPASLLLGRNIALMAWLSPVVAGALLFLAYRIWLFGLHHYSSTGS